MARALQFVWLFVSSVGFLAAATIPRFYSGGLVLGVAGICLAAYTHYQIVTKLEDLELESQREAKRVAELEAEITQNRDSVDELADGLDVMIFVTDTRGRVLYANNRAVETFRFDDPEGQSLSSITLSPQIAELVAEVAENGTVHRKEVKLHHPEELSAIVRGWKSSIGDRVFVTLYDITTVRRLERVRSDFVANVSHELRTPLTTIRAMAETMNDDQFSDLSLADKYTNQIIKEVDRLTRITDDLLTLSKLEQSPSTERMAFDIAEVALSIVNSLTSKAEALGLQLGYSGPDSCMYFGNSTQLGQLIFNLLDNSINYTKEGSIMVSLRDLDDHVSLTISDTGIGIAQEHQDRIFERFYRVDKGRSRVTGGTGLGLSIVKHIVEAHDGKITLQSDFGVGSKFMVELPKL